MIAGSSNTLYNVYNLIRTNEQNHSRREAKPMVDQLLGRHFISLFLIFLFAIRLGSQRSAKDKGLNYFWLTVISCLLLVLEDSLEMWAREHPDMRFWRTLFSVA